MTQASPSAPPAPATKPVQKHHLFSLRVKFLLALTLLICAVMGVVTLLILTQLQQTLTQQVISRGEAQAKSLASNSADPVFNDLTKPPPYRGDRARTSTSRWPNPPRTPWNWNRPHPPRISRPA